MHELYRSIPAIDRSIKALLEIEPELGSMPPALLKERVTQYWDGLREAIRTGEQKTEIVPEEHLPALAQYARKGGKPNLRRVINGTGVIIHTNLGRSLLASPACDAVAMAASSYCNLEMNLETGERGSRNNLTRDLIRKLTGAQDALVVNNNAAAVLLVLDTLCSGGETIVSRGELVEIGGSFRIPDIMLKSGTILKEVGTTNRTHPEDYLRAITPQTKAIMRVHASNFRITGFHASVDLQTLKSIAAEHELPLIVDLGSGSLVDLAGSGLPPEPVAREILARGADIVCFSGDKALGGPQAGLIAGNGIYIEKLKRNPLSRALRCGKLSLAALEATLRLYLDSETARREIPTLRMLLIKPEEIAGKAGALASSLRQIFAERGIDCRVDCMEAESRVGGGSFPECELATTLVSLAPAGISVDTLRKRLLKGDTPVAGRIEKGAFCLDPRTLQPGDYPVLVRQLANALLEA